MTAFSVFAAVAFAGVAVSYGWGMRGFIIGGEKGALLPGALLGMSIALFCCNGQISGYLPFFCAAGALSMFYGGTEPYAQTMGFILHRENQPYSGKVHKGAGGIFLKGGLWFGISAAVLAMLTGAVGGIYGKTDIIVMFALIPVLSFAGTLIFNSPYNKSTNTFPKIYFSLTSREEWGGNLLILVALCVNAAVHKDIFLLGAALTGIISGGLGFLLGLLIYDYVSRPHKGKTVFGKLNKNGFIDGWKIMEHFFGAFAGGLVMLYFCLCSNLISQRLNSKFYSFTMSNTADTVCSYICIFLLLLTAVQYPVAKKLKKDNISLNINLFELLERPLWSALPLIFIFLGSTKTAYMCAFVTVAYALTEKCVFEWYEKASRLPIFIVFGIFFVACCIYFALYGTIPAIILAMLYTIIYTVPTLCYVFLYKKKDYALSNKSFSEFYKSGITVSLHFVLQCAVIIAVVYIKSAF